MTLRLIDTMSTKEIEEFLYERKYVEHSKPVAFFVPSTTMLTYKKIRKELAKKIPHPPATEKPSKYIFSAELEVKEKIQLEFENGKPKRVTFAGSDIGTFSMTRVYKDDVEYSTESGSCEEFWKLLEQHPNLHVQVQTSMTSVGESHHMKIYATVLIGDMSWFY